MSGIANSEALFACEMKLKILGSLLGKKKFIYACVVYVCMCLAVNSNHAGFFHMELLSRSLSGAEERWSDPVTTCTTQIPSTEEFCQMCNFVDCNIAGLDFFPTLLGY